MEHSCFTHPTRQALSFCRSCGSYFCSDCLVESEEFYYCRDETCQNELRQETVRIPSEPEMETSKLSFFKKVSMLGTWVWPSITDVNSAKKTSKQGYWACGLVAGSGILFVILGLSGTGLLNIVLSLLAVLIFMIIGWGVYRMNRVAAGAGIMIYLFDNVLMWAETGHSPSGLAPIILLMFVNSVRGTFEYHRYRKETGSSEKLVPTES